MTADTPDQPGHGASGNGSATRPDHQATDIQANNNQTSGGHAPPADGLPPSPFDKPTPDGAATTVSAVLGEIVWLLTQSPLHKQFFLSDLEWLVMTPIVLQQFRLFYQDAPPEQGGRRPIGVTLWGLVSDDVEARLAEGTTRLRPQDWHSGQRAWVVEVVAPFGGGDAMVADLKRTVFPDQELRVLTLVDGRREVKVMVGGVDDTGLCG